MTKSQISNFRSQTVGATFMAPKKGSIPLGAQVNQTPTFWGLLLATLYLLFATSFNSFAAEPTDAGWGYFLKGDYEKAIELSEKQEGCKAHYIMGLSYLKLDKPVQAREHFVFILDTYPDADIKQEIILSIADSYFLEGDFENAINKSADFLKNFPSSGLLSLAYLKLGQSQRRLGKWPQAKETLEMVIRDFPSSIEKTEAEKELQKEFFYYIQAGSFTREQNATRAEEALIKKGFDARINTVTQDSKAYYRVCVGRFEKKEDALLVLQKLESYGYAAKLHP